MTQRSEILRAASEAARVFADIPHDKRTSFDIVGAVMGMNIPLVFQPLENLIGTAVTIGRARGIMISTKRDLHVQRFTLAHELGHLRLGHPFKLDETVGFAGRNAWERDMGRTPTSFMPSPMSSSRRTARMGRSGLNAAPCKGRARYRRLAARNWGRRLDRPAREHPRPAGASARRARRGARGRRAHRVLHPRAHQRGPARTDGYAARRRGLGKIFVSDGQRCTPTALRALAIWRSFLR